MSSADLATAVVVSHTHWDRAWYLPFQEYRIRLVRLLDRVLDLLPQVPEFHSFMLDGQMSAIEDYLEVRPERRDDLERLVRDGRLVVGPWYVQPDEYLVSPEAMVRNLVIGMELAEDVGATMRIGYLPDSFGHIGQLPQILRGVGIDAAVVWRGFGDEGEELGSEFWWHAPDGSRVLTLRLIDGYHNAANLGFPMRFGDPDAMEFDQDLALKQLRSAVNEVGGAANTAFYLLMNGVDHVEPNRVIPDLLARANERFDDVRLQHGSLADHLRYLREHADVESLPSFTGELNRSRYAPVLKGVHSTRMYLKQANERAQTMLECYAEPLSAWAWTLGAEYPQALLRFAWKELLKNHPHDDISGCGVDQVHDEDMVRFAEVGQIGWNLARNSSRALTRAIDLGSQDGVPFVLFNTAGAARTGTVEVIASFSANNDLVGDFHLVDDDGRHVPHQELDREEHFEMEVGRPKHRTRVRCAVAVRELPACGYRVYHAVAGSREAQVAAPVSVTDRRMENRYLQVDVNPDGTFDLFDKRSGRQLSGLGYLLDEADAGDQYDHAPCAQPHPVSSAGGTARVTVHHAGPLQAAIAVALDLELPVSLTDDRQRRASERVICPVTTTVTLRHDIPFVEVATTVDNRAEDHRLRVCFPTDVTTASAAADAHFDVLTRPLDTSPAHGWAQPPSPTHHQRYFVDLSDGDSGVALFNRGLPECEILADGDRRTIALTLLRCVGAISEETLVTRPQEAGPPAKAPGGQCPGQHTFDYAVAPHQGDWQVIYRDALNYRAPVYLRRGDDREGYDPNQAFPTDHAGLRDLGATRMKPFERGGELPSELSFLSVEPAMLTLSAIKRAEHDDRLVVRVFNPTDAAVAGRLTLFRPVAEAATVDLRERDVARLTPDGHTVDVAVDAKQITTLALRLERPQASP